MKQIEKRDIWVDNIKVVACILVVLGHFFQSMVQAGILDKSFLFRWFNTTIYYFHVPLFFICSGYLYQKYSKVYKLEDWGRSVTKKFISLGIPYFTFSFFTWILKRIFSSSVNSQARGLIETFFIKPVPPYWYLYILFGLFFITITVKTNIELWSILTISLILKLIFCNGILTGIYLIDRVMANWIWFVIGITIAFCNIKFPNIGKTMLIFFGFIGASIFVYYKNIQGGVIVFVLAITACYSIVGIFQSFELRQRYVFPLLSKFTMPIFLMHTLFAAPLRSILLRIGVANPVIHIVMGLIISFCGPIVAMIIMEKIRPLDFFVYPTRYIKIGKRR